MICHSRFSSTCSARESVFFCRMRRRRASSPTDEYLRRHHARSVLCIPLLKQARLAGIIYLENNLTSGAFTPARMALLEVLASDAAISLENARLYHDFRNASASRA